MQYVPADQLAETIVELSDKFKYFHLTKCICGAPMWQQPCAICGYYPMWHDDRLYKAQTGMDPHHMKRDSCTKEHFIKRVELAGNFFEFYCSSFLKCVDPETHKVDAARELAVGLEWTSPGEIWDHYRDANIDSMGKEKESV